MLFKSLENGRDALCRVRIGRVALVATALCAAFTPSPSHAAEKSVALYCAGYRGTTTLENFQALVKLTEGQYGFSYADGESDGSDIWFSDSSDNPIPHEIDTWTQNGTSFIWVRIPQVVDRTSNIKMHWGDLSSKQSASGDVWDGFTGVWHIGKETDALGRAGPVELDSTGHGLHAAAVGTETNNMTLADGVVGSSRTGAKSGLQTPYYGDYITDGAKFAASGWWYVTGTGTALRMLSTRRYYTNGIDDADDSLKTYWDIYNNNRSNDYTQVCVSSGYPGSISEYNLGYVLDLNQWRYISVVYEGSTVTVYMDGEQVQTYTKCSTNAVPPCGLTIGGLDIKVHSGYYTRGRYDEIRIHDGVQSADRVKADYDTMNSPTTFLDEGVDIVYTATWTGNGEAGNVADADNWSCTNLQGTAISGRIPTADTIVTLSGDNLTFQAGTGTSFTCRSLSVTNCTLGADCDWTGLPSGFTIDGTVNLNGNKLYLAELNGSGEITDGSDDDELVVNGSFENLTGTISGSDGYGSLSASLYPNDWTLSTYSGVLLVRPGYNIETKKAFFWTSSSAPGGTNVLFLQGDKQLYQNIQVTTPGKYIVSLWYAVRKDGRNTIDYSGATISMQIDGDNIQSVVTRECVSNADEREFRKLCAEVELTAGTHEIRIVSQKGSSTGTEAYNEGIDFVSVRPAGGELHLVSDSNVENSTVSLTGTLRLVKEGSGTFTATKARQSYAGGTEILKGTVRPGIVGSLWPFGAENSEILISTNNSSQAVFEMNTKNNFYGYRFVLNGGKLQNYLGDIGASLSQIKNIRLTADSDIYVRHNFGLTYYTGDKQTVLDLGGHTLSLNTDSGRWFILANTVVSNGTINATGAGGVLAHKAGAVTNPRVEASTASFNISVGFGADVPVSLRDYMVNAVNPSLFQGTCTVEVSRVFSPVSDKFHNTLLLDGATLDLSGRTGTLASPSADSRTVSFAAGAAVTVNLAGRDVQELKALAKSGSPYLVTWYSAPDVTFALDDETAALRVFKLHKDAGGLAIRAVQGLMVIVK